MKGPLGRDLEWYTETTRSDENKRIAWRTLEGDIKTSGQVTFNSLPDQETEMTIMTQYVPPEGAISEMASSIFTDFESKVEKDLLNFKAYAEGMHNRINLKSKD